MRKLSLANRISVSYITVLSVAAFASQAVMASAPADEGIQIVTATFGTVNRPQKLDISGSLQQICGAESKSCTVFCSETSFGRYSLGDRPICRVIYRCGAEWTGSVEAAREEPILMRCLDVAETPDPVAPAYARP